MASKLKANYHIPLCERESHLKWINELSKRLKAKQETCIEKYPLNGPFPSWFLEGLNNCDFTIIHICTKLENKIEECKQELSKNLKKLILIKFNDHHTKAFTELKEKFTVSHIIDDVALENFIDQLVATKDKSADGLKSENTEKFDIPLSSLKYVELKDSDKFVQYPDFFDRPNDFQPFIKECFLTSEKVLEKSNMENRITKLNALTKENENFVYEIQFFMFKLLPTLFREQEAYVLGHISVCPQPLLQSKSIILVELILLTASSQDKERLSPNIFINLENIIYQALRNLHKNEQNDQVAETIAVIEQLKYFYFIIICEWLYSCSEDKMKLFAFHMSRTVASRSVFPVANSLIDSSFTDLRTFISEFKQEKKCVTLKKRTRKMLDSEISPQDLAKVLRRSFTTEMFLVYCLVKKIFNSQDQKAVEFFKNSFDLQDTERPALSVSLFVHSITLFLCFEIKNVESKDGVVNLCTSCMEIVLKYMSSKMTDLQQMLVFHQNPIIRRSVLNKLPDYAKIMPMIYTELKNLLVPVLELDSSQMKLMKTLLIQHAVLQQDDPNQFESTNWHCGEARLNGHQVLLHVHKPSKTDHIERNKSEFHFHQDVFYNELEKLQKLKHENIIQLLAFRHHCIPSFYIVEDYKVTNLQETLRNIRKINGSLYRPDILHSFVVGALMAVQHCHELGFVHRNLTAGSLFIVEERKVKLCGFHLCLEVKDGNIRPDDKMEKHRSLRWTAPESLHNFEYSKASDMWMVGHLLNEIFTHGMFPYEDFLTSDEEVTSYIQEDGSIPMEACIPEKLFKYIIEPCNSKLPHERPTVANVIEKLKRVDPETLQWELSNSESQTKTKIEKGAQATIHNPKFIEDITGDEDKNLDLVSISETITKIKLTHQHIFREKLSERVPPELSSQIDSKQLYDLIGDVRIVQNRQAHHIECNIPSSCSGNLLDVALKKSLGQGPQNYLQCITVLGSVLMKLWSNSWIIGDLGADNVYVNKEHQNYKVYLVSMSYLKHLESNLHIKKQISHEASTLSRAAPEVVKSNAFTCESDVYCFGYLIWEIFTALHKDGTKVEEFRKLTSLDTTKEEDIYKHVASRTRFCFPSCCDERSTVYCCSQAMKQFILTCCHIQQTKRPRKNLVQKFKEICKTDYDCQFSE
ncbi:fibroblast growth factor receptor 3-like isoform X3 [Biomphalaria glabrata]|nr:fibroblast growth factor receptor 3-like isoform X3 [Biomphalaria glabrata]